ncbi:transcriptional repressor NrdR [Candidatus Berkelbacteria bacterium]|nr:transcriptional repressor NrdR [Candidatus Berkelbacteria bacterium]
MVCPTCKKGETRVIDSREDEQAIRRRRECMACQARFTTFERIEVLNLLVVKRDGSRQPFSKDKLLEGIKHAAEKRPVQAEAIVDAIERDLYSEGKAEVSSKKIGQLVLEHLKAADPVAYIRFASVYRSFENLEEFEQELAAIVADQARETRDARRKTVDEQQRLEG